MNLMNFLMTPNDVVNNFMLCISTFIEASLYLLLFSEAINIKFSKKQFLIYVVLTSIVSIFTICVIPNSFSILINLLSFVLLVHILFNQTFRNTLIAVLVTYISIFVSSFTTQLFFNLLFGISYIDLIAIPLYHLIGLILNYAIFCLIYILLKQRKQIKKIITISLKSTIVINLILGIITIFILTYIFSLYKDAFPNSLKIITISTLLLYFFISMYGLIRTKKLEQTKQDLETEKLYTKTLTLLNDNIRCFKHDFINIVQAIGGYVTLKDMDGLRKYYDQLLDDCKRTNDLNTLNPETINNPGVYSILTTKYYTALEKNIKITFNIFIDLQKLNIDTYNFCRILGILLDNALEAAEESDKKFIHIDFQQDSKKQLFIIENSCKDSNISTSKIFEKGYSTKAHNSGIGLWKVHNILLKNKTADLYTTVKDNIFKQELSIFFDKT